MANGVRSLVSAFAGVVVLGALLAETAPAQVPAQARMPRIPGVEQYAIQDLDLPSSAGDSFGFTVELGGEPITVYLVPHSLRAESFVLQVVGEDGELVTLELPAPTTYRGVVAEYPESIVSASLGENSLTAAISLSSERPSWWIEPLQRFHRSAPPGTHAVYSSEDVAEDWGRCGLEEPPSQQPGGRQHVAQGGGGEVQPILGGMLAVTLTGTGFSSAILVRVGFVDALPWSGAVRIESDSTIILHAPPPVAFGTVQVRVQNLAGVSAPLSLTFVETSPPCLEAAESFIPTVPSGSLTWSYGGGAGDTANLLVNFDYATTTIGGLVILANAQIVVTESLDSVGLGAHEQIFSDSDIPPNLDRFYSQIVTTDAAGHLEASNIEMTLIIH